MTPTEKEADIKPCPFCGGKAELTQTGHNKAKIRCVSCLVGIEQKVLRYSLDWLKSKLIEDWNKRV